MTEVRFEKETKVHIIVVLIIVRVGYFLHFSVSSKICEKEKPVADSLEGYINLFQSTHLHIDLMSSFLILAGLRISK